MHMDMDVDNDIGAHAEEGDVFVCQEKCPWQWQWMLRYTVCDIIWGMP